MGAAIEQRCEDLTRAGFEEGKCGWRRMEEAVGMGCGSVFAGVDICKGRCEEVDPVLCVLSGKRYCRVGGWVDLGRFVNTRAIALGKLPAVW